MMADELLAECIAAWERDAEFPTIWNDILRIHPLTAGAAFEMADAEHIWQEVPLTTGQRLVYHREDGFSLLERQAIEVRTGPPV
jgi:hypothetical protein